MSRQKYQRPEVYATGKREKLWKGEWKEYYVKPDGSQAYHHRARTWPRATHSKADAQAKLDAIIRELQQGGPKADGSMTLEAFWQTVYWPIKAKRWGLNTRKQVSYLWTNYVKPALGQKPLQDLRRPDVEMFLVQVADTGKSKSTIESVASHLNAAMMYALDADYIAKNPCRKVELPTCKPPKETRALAAEEVTRLWDRTDGTDYLIWRVLLLTGVRISELLALERTDILPDGRLRIDESALERQASTTKSKKPRVAPMPTSLREELQEYLGAHPHQLIFPHPDGKMGAYDDTFMRAIVDRARTAAEIPDLTPRMCRTTFATLFEGDIKDAQDIMGHHSSTFTLQVYKKPIAGRAMAAIEDLDKRLNVVPIRKPA